jgi:hypothetical protein
MTLLEWKSYARFYEQRTAELDKELRALKELCDMQRAEIKRLNTVIERLKASLDRY